jgi:hypothetical protein
VFPGRRFLCRRDEIGRIDRGQGTSAAFAVYYIAMRRYALLCVCVLVLAGCGSSAHVSTTQRFESKGYKAAVAYAQCMREHGVAHPNPNRAGDFELTPKQEARMRASALPKEHGAADAACFHFLRGTSSTKPLSKEAQKAALVPLRELKSCLAAHGYHVGRPIVKLMPRGRAMFGFDRAVRTPPPVQHGCEAKVHLAKRLSTIIRTDRTDGG